MGLGGQAYVLCARACLCALAALALLPAAATAAPTNTAPPTITGAAQVGGQLICTPGTWISAVGGTVTDTGFSWLREPGDTVVKDSRSGTDNAYTPVAADAGSALVCSETVTDSADASTGSARSAPTAAIAFPSMPTLGLTLERGWIDASVGGEPGASVAVSELAAGTPAPLGDVSLTGGVARLAHLVQWRCDRRRRTFLARQTDGASVTASIETPSCARRLELRTPSRGTAGGTIRLLVRDRWGLGGVRFSLCIQPPAYRPRCHRHRLAAGRPLGKLAIRVASPGTWLVVVKTRFGERLRRSARVAHPGGRLQILATGDSEIQILDQFLAAAVAPFGAGVTSDAIVGTGISKLQQLDWVRHAWWQSGADQPDVTVVFIGANDGFALPGPGGLVQCCGRDWSGLLSGRVSSMMQAYVRRGAGRVYWFMLPIPRDPTWATSFRAVDLAFELAAARNPDGVRLIHDERVFTPGGAFRQTIVYHGQTVDVRQADGLHLNPAGDRIALAMLLAAMRKDRVLG